MTTTAIAIHGGGIAGLWILGRLRNTGHDAVLYEKTALGAGQTIASQGIIHSGLKYGIGGGAALAALRDMPALWRREFSGCIAADSQWLMIPESLATPLLAAGAKLLLRGARDLPPAHWPEAFRASGFRGTILSLPEPVMDVAKVLGTFSKRHADRITSVPPSQTALSLFTCGGGNAGEAARHGHSIAAQTRPLLMAMMKPAPFPLFAHLAGMSDKPAATITTHTARDGTPVWYIGGGAAERPKDSDPAALFRDVQNLLHKYMPALSFANTLWAALPIDRHEGVTDESGAMPGAPVIQKHGHHWYCWPTKLAFAPLLADKILASLPAPAHNTRPAMHDEIAIASPPWDTAAWT